MICLFVLLLNLQRALSSDDILMDQDSEAKEVDPASPKFDISLYSDKVRAPLRCDEQGSYLPKEWQSFFERGEGWCYFSYSREKYDEEFADKNVFQCFKFHVGSPKIHNEEHVEFEREELERVRMTEMQHPLIKEYYEKNLAKQAQMKRYPGRYKRQLRDVKIKLFKVETYQVAEYIYAQRIVEIILPFLIENGFAFKISQGFLYMDSANDRVEGTGKLIVIYTPTTKKAKFLIPALVQLLEEIDLERFEFYHPPEGEIFKGLYTRYGGCYSQFPGNFAAKGEDGKTICRNSEDQIIRCSDGRPFLYSSDDGKNRYIKFSDYNTVKFRDRSQRKNASENDYLVQLPGDSQIYSYRYEFWMFLGMIGALSKSQRREQCQWVKDFYEDSGIHVKNWPGGPGKRLAHGPDLKLKRRAYLLDE